MLYIEKGKKREKMKGLKEKKMMLKK